MLSPDIEAEPLWAHRIGSADIVAPWLTNYPVSEAGIKPCDSITPQLSKQQHVSRPEGHTISHNHDEMASRIRCHLDKGTIP